MRDQDEIGSNIPLLQKVYSDDKAFLMADYLDVPTSVRVFRNKIYIADQYNRRISIFPLNTANPTNTYIPSEGPGYKFGIPFQIVLNKYGEIYVLASVSNNLTDPGVVTDNNGLAAAAPEDNGTNYNQYYIYKFSPEGNFIYQIGENGINTGPMEYPERIDVDLFDNVYAYYKQYDGYRVQWLVKSFSTTTGEPSFEINTRYMIPGTNVIGSKVFASTVSGIYNLKNDERLMIFSENQIIGRKGKSGTNENVDTPDEYYDSIDACSVLQNALTKNIYTSKKYMDHIIDITKDDVLVMTSYDDKYAGIRYRFIDIGNKNKEDTYYEPLLPRQYLQVGNFIDDSGQIYSIIIKDRTYYVVLRWKKVKSRNLPG